MLKGGILKKVKLPAEEDVPPERENPISILDKSRACAECEKSALNITGAQSCFVLDSLVVHIDTLKKFKSKFNAAERKRITLDIRTLLLHSLGQFRATVVAMLRHLILTDRKSCVKNTETIKCCMDVLECVDKHIICATKHHITVNELSEIFNNCVLLELSFNQSVRVYCIESRRVDGPPPENSIWQYIWSWLKCFGFCCYSDPNKH